MKRAAVAVGLAVVLAVVAASAQGRAAAPTCRAAQLRPHFFMQGATGSLAGGVYVRNVSRTTCALVGLPYVKLVGGGARHARSQLYRLRNGSDGIPHPPTTPLHHFRHGQRALLSVIWSNWCHARPVDLVVVLPHRGGKLRWKLPRFTPRCDQSSRPSRLGISRFAPV